MAESEIREYYDTIRPSYTLLCKEEKNADLKSKLGYRFNSLLIVLFVLTVSQVIPLWLLSLLPEAIRLITFWRISIPGVIPINVVLLLLLKYLHTLNKEKLVYARVRRRRRPERIGPLQKAFSAIFSSLIELKAYRETNDEVHIKAAKEHYDIFRDTLPFELHYADKYSLDWESVFVQKYRETHLPWFTLTSEQIDDIESIRYCLWQTSIRIWDKKQIDDVIPALEALSKVYFDAIKDKPSASHDFAQFKDKAKAIPGLKRTPKAPTARMEASIAAIMQKLTRNFVLYLLLSFAGWLIVTFILVYWPCRAFFGASPDVLAPVVFATAITLALMDANKNVKTDVDGEVHKKVGPHDDE